MRSQRDDLKKHADQLRGDVNRGTDPQHSRAPRKKNTISSIRRNFSARRIGYSAIETDLTTLAAKSGLRMTGIQFTQKEVKGRGVSDVGNFGKRGRELQLDRPVHRRSRALQVFLFAEESKARFGHNAGGPNPFAVRVAYLFQDLADEAARSNLCARRPVGGGGLISPRATSPVPVWAFWPATRNFVPLNVDEPQLRLDLLDELKELTYKGAHRDIFNPMRCR